MSKETKSKLYWSTMVTSADQNSNPREVEFRLYIHKWRVPEPYPQTIYIKIEPSQLQQKPKFLSVDEALDNPDLRVKPINAIIHGFKRYPGALGITLLKTTPNGKSASPMFPTTSPSANPNT